MPGPASLQDRLHIDADGGVTDEWATRGRDRVAVLGLSAIGFVLLALAGWATVLAYGTFRFDRLPAPLQRNSGVRLAVDTLWFPFVAIALWLALALLIAFAIDTEASLEVAVVVGLLFLANVGVALLAALLSVFTSFRPTRARTKRSGEDGDDGRPLG